MRSKLEIMAEGVRGSKDMAFVACSAALLMGGLHGTAAAEVGQVTLFVATMVAIWKRHEAHMELVRRGFAKEWEV